MNKEKSGKKESRVKRQRDRLDARIKFRVSEIEMGMLRKQAKKANLTVSAYIRGLIEKGIP